ncbi:MAG: DUF2817 domain-containing protein [Rhodoferax sp.]|nr:DUF2817 domain-containing protein [Rhodoferax sp.]
MDLAQTFSPTYALARVQFLEAAAAVGLKTQSHLHPLKGRDGETLAMDVGWTLFTPTPTCGKARPSARRARPCSRPWPG